MQVLYVPASREGVIESIGLVVLSVVLVVAGCGKHQESLPAGMPKPKVAVSRPLEQEIIEWDQYTGQFAAIDSVDVRARVSGYLESIHFTDGALVHTGDLLFVIDSRPFQAALEQAKGSERQAEATYALAKWRLVRDRGLLKTSAISQEQYEIQVSTTDQAAGAVQAAKGTVRNAELNLEFTQVRSPINGRIGRHQVTVGNLISGGTSNATLLATIVSLDPIYFYFDVDERAYLRYVHQAEEGERPPVHELRAEVFAKLWNERGFGHRGQIDYVAPQIDPNTATLRFRAVFPNPQMTMRPGMFGTVRFPGSKYKAILLSGAAVGREQTIQYVYVVKKGNVVARRMVQLGPEACGLRIVKKGVTASDTVVINGLQSVRPGMAVQPAEQQIGLESTDCLAKRYPRIFGAGAPHTANREKSSAR
jgi:RND family efflux transporter MFP subunit